MNSTNKRTVYVVGNGKRFLNGIHTLGSFNAAIFYDSVHGADKALSRINRYHNDMKARLARVIAEGGGDYWYVDSEEGKQNIARMKKYIRNSNPKGLKVMKVTVTLG